MALALVHLPCKASFCFFNSSRPDIVMLPERAFPRNRIGCRQRVELLVELGSGGAGPFLSGAGSLRVCGLSLAATGLIGGGGVVTSHTSSHITRVLTRAATAQCSQLAQGHFPAPSACKLKTLRHTIPYGLN